MDLIAAGTRRLVRFHKNLGCPLAHAECSHRFLVSRSKSAIETDPSTLLTSCSRCRCVIDSGYNLFGGSSEGFLGVAARAERRREQRGIGVGVGAGITRAPDEFQSGLQRVESGRMRAACYALMPVIWPCRYRLCGLTWPQWKQAWALAG